MPASRPSTREGVLPVRALLLVVAAAAVGRGAAAQPASAAVTPGARVRVEAPGHGRATWDVSGIRRDTLLLLPAGVGRGPRTAVALSDVTRLEVNHGPRRNILLGAAAGLALGAAAGAVYGASHPGPLAGLCFCPEARRPDPVFWTALGAMVGPPVGALAGRLVFGDHWQRVTPRPARLGISAGPRGSARVALALPAR